MRQRHVERGLRSSSADWLEDPADGGVGPRNRSCIRWRNAAQLRVFIRFYGSTGGSESVNKRTITVLGLHLSYDLSLYELGRFQASQLRRP